MRAKRMKKPGICFAASCLLLGWLVTCGGVSAETIQSGRWQATETIKDEAGKPAVLWSFEIRDDGGATINAIGDRYESDGKPIRDRSIAVLFIDKHEDGTFSGTYIESYGSGKQIELKLTIELSNDGRTMQLETANSSGKVVSRFDANWLGQGLRADFKSGSWIVREIVAPGKGSWDIEWNYQIKEHDGQISGRGNKSIVNNRKSYPGERKTYCNIILKRDPDQIYIASGDAVETNHVGKKTRAAYRGWVSPSGRTFFMISYEKDRLAALLVGRFAG